jgi:anthranilate phosphoribosyltransferase
MEFAPLLRRVLGGEDLAADEAAAFVGEIMDASFTPVQAAALLTALAFKGESVDEIVGAARAMRERSSARRARFADGRRRRRDGRRSCQHH